MDSVSPAADSALFPESSARLPDDTMFFSIAPDFCHPSLKITDPGNLDLTSSLHSLHVQIIELVSTHISCYIWQHEPFNLTAYFHDCYICSTKLPHIHGKLRFGDNLEDEWFVVFLMFYISRSFLTISIRIWDTDGEFLLIEAAYHLPRWLNPENSSNRVFIRSGDLHIIPKNRISNPSLLDSLSYLVDFPDQSRASDSAQSAVQKRISEFPERAIRNMHGARVRVPVSVAQLLKHEPGLIALAVEGFYDRDIDTMKYAAKMEKFLSDDSDRDLVQVWARMSRAMYAQLVQQNFQAPKCYPMPTRSNKVSYAEYEIGMKITCGFEMMYQQRQVNALEGKGSTWGTFKESLEKSGYFKGLLPGSKEYTTLMDNALTYYNNSHLFSRTSEMMSSPVTHIDGILALPFQIDDFMDQVIPPSDDDCWLYEGEEKLNYDLLEREKEIQQYDETHKNNTKSENVSEHRSHFDVDAANIVKHMQSFMHKISSHEGAEVPENRESQVIDFNADRFMEDLKSALLKTPSEKVVSNGHDIGEDSSDMDFDDGYGNSSENGESSYEDIDEDEFTHSYSDALAEELEATTLKKTFSHPLQKPAKGTSPIEAGVLDKGGNSDADDYTPVDVDINLVKNLITSFSSQQGLPGPASNIMGLMGLQLPHVDNK